MKRRYFIGLALAAVLATAEFAFGQSIGPVAGQGPGNIGQPFNVRSGHLSIGGSAPSVNSACGTGAASVGSDTAFQLSSGTGTSSACKVTPATAWKRMPICTVEDQSGTEPAYSIGATGIISLTGVSDSHTYNVHCIGQPGG